jgi:hypothetical protein
LIPNLSGTITPWVLGGLASLVLLTVSITIKAWRDAKRSPFFFLRLQAQKRLQRYSLASLALIVATFATAAYAWQPVEQSAQRVALIHNAKPAEVAIAAVDEAEEPAEGESGSPETVQIALNVPAAAPRAAESASEVASGLPAEYDQFDPTAELTADTELGQLFFSTRIDADYQAVEPGRRFSKGQFTLYATFEYGAMADGMAWAWVWRRNGEVVGGGNELWAYGQEGPGYVYLRPEEGFRVGQYSLEIWVNGELLTQGSFQISDGINASN